MRHHEDISLIFSFMVLNLALTMPCIICNQEKFYPCGKKTKSDLFNKFSIHHIDVNLKHYF